MRKKKERDSDDPTLFDFVNQVLLKTENFPFDKKVCNGWALTHILSHEPRYMKHIQSMNRVLFNVPDSCVYLYYFSVLPKGKRYIKIPKKSDEGDLSDITLKYDVSKREAQMILALKERLKKNANAD